MKIISCSKCFAVVKPNKTTVKEGKRICHKCKNEAKKEAIKEWELRIEGER